MAKCKQCGAENAFDVTTCDYCGSSLQTDKQSMISNKKYSTSNVSEGFNDEFVMLSKVNMIDAFGELKKAPQGFCWEILFLGPLIPFLRKDWQTGFGILIGAIILAAAFDETGLTITWLFTIFLAFKYNAYYTKKLLNDGYFPADKNSRGTLKSNGL